MPQQIQGHFFPIPLEWLGGRNTLQPSAFSSRNARICLEDMIDSELTIPVILETDDYEVIFRTANETISKNIDMGTITDIHLFPSYPTYAVLEISSINGPSRFEVLRTSRNEPLNQLYDFLFTRNIGRPAAPVLPRDNNSPIFSSSDGYEEPVTRRPAINGHYTPEFQTEESYEEVDVKTVDEATNENESITQSSIEKMAMTPEVPLEVHVTEEVKDFEEEEEENDGYDDEKLNEPWSHSCNTTRGNVQEASVPLAGAVEVKPIISNIVQVSSTTKASQLNHFCNLHSLAGIIEAKQIDLKHYRDDGVVYIFMRTTLKPSNGKPLAVGPIKKEKKSLTNEEKSPRYRQPKSRSFDKKRTSRKERR